MYINSGCSANLKDLYIPSGATVAVSGGRLAVEKVTGNGGTVNLGGTMCFITANAFATSVAITNGGDAAFKINSGGHLVMSRVSMYGNTGGYGDVLVNNPSAILALNGDCNLNTITLYYGKTMMHGSNVLSGKIEAVSGAPGSVTISSGAIIDLTGNSNATPINPGGGIVVSGGCTVINSAGASVSIAGGTYTKINKDGTTA